MSRLRLENLDLNKEEIEKLKSSNNLLASLHLILRLLGEGILVFGLYLSLNLESPFSSVLILLSMLVLGFYHSFWGYAGYGHELFHNRVFSSSSINRMLFIFSSAITFNNRVFFENTHLRHHGKTFSDEDVEVDIQDFSKLSIIRYIFIDPVIIYRRFSYLLKNLIGIVPVEYEELKTSISRSSLEIISINGFIYFFLFYLTNSSSLVVLFFLSQFTCSFFYKVLAQAQHLGLEHLKDQGPLFHSRTILLPIPLSFLYANMNYHREHHLFPTIPYYNLAKINSILKKANIITEDDDLSYFKVDFWKSIKSSSQTIEY